MPAAARYDAASSAVKPQVVGPHLDQPPMGPQTGQRERRILAGRHDEVGERRPTLDQEADQARGSIRR